MACGAGTDSRAKEPFFTLLPMRLASFRPGVLPMSRTLQNQRNGREVWQKEMESGITGHPSCHIPLYGLRQMTLPL